MGILYRKDEYKYPSFSTCFFLKPELEEDNLILKCAHETLETESNADPEGKWVDLQLSLIQKVKRINEFLLAAFPKDDSSEEFTSDDSAGEFTSDGSHEEDSDKVCKHL